MLNVLEVHSIADDKKKGYVSHTYIFISDSSSKAIPVVLCVMSKDKTGVKNCSNYLCELSRSHCGLYEDYCL
jgi:hypothetical protein